MAAQQLPRAITHTGARGHCEGRTHAPHANTPHEYLRVCGVKTAVDGLAVRAVPEQAGRGRRTDVGATLHTLHTLHALHALHTLHTLHTLHALRMYTHGRTLHTRDASASLSAGATLHAGVTLVNATLHTRLHALHALHALHTLHTLHTQHTLRMYTHGHALQTRTPASRCCGRYGTRERRAEAGAAHIGDSLR